MLRKIKFIFTSSLPITVKRAIALSFANLYRNKFFSISTILVISLILFILNVTMGLNIFATKKIATLEGKVDIIVYLKDDADPLRIKNLEDNLKSMEEVSSVTYTSKEEALKNFLKNYPEKDNPFDKYIMHNPLPADLKIKTNRAEDHQKVRNFLKQGEYSDLLSSVSESDIINQQITSNLIQFTSSIEKFFWWLIATFTVSTALIIINSINLTIYSRKEDIEIMTLVGSRPLFISLPFIFEGLLYGLTASLINIGVIILATKYSYITQFFNDINYLSTPLYIVSEIVLISGLGIISAWIAVKLHFYKKQKRS